MCDERCQCSVFVCLCVCACAWWFCVCSFVGDGVSAFELLFVVCCLSLCGFEFVDSLAEWLMR